MDEQALLDGGGSPIIERAAGRAVCAVRRGIALSSKRRFLEGKDKRQVSEVQMRAVLCSG